jgi:TolB-like protein
MTEAVALEQPAGRLNLPPSIAVLPFSNMSRDRTMNTSDGLAEEVINALTQVPDLRDRTNVGLRSKGIRTSDALRRWCHQHPGRQRTAIAFASRSDHGVGRHIMVQRYDRELEDVFAVQEKLRRQSPERWRKTGGGASPHAHACRLPGLLKAQHY